MKAAKTIATAALAVLILVSSTSFVVGMHLCMGEVQSIALFSKADGCEKERELPPCHRHATAPCCDDEAVVHTADDFRTASAEVHISIPTPSDLEQPLVLISEVIPAAPVAFFSYLKYDSPLRSADLTVENQVFLI